jgi:hypothetical protein
MSWWGGCIESEVVGVVGVVVAHSEVLAVGCVAIELGHMYGYSQSE